MSNVPIWDVAAGNNASAPPDGAPEGMAPSAVNDTMREMMAALKRWYEDQRAGGKVSTNSGNDYFLSTNATYAALNQIPIISFRINAANTGACTLDIDGLGELPWYKGYSNSGGVDFAAGDLVPNRFVSVAYNGTLTAYLLMDGLAGEFDVGTSLMVMQASAPNGWTKDTTASLSNAAVRLTTGTGGGSGGSANFTTAFASRSIAQTNLPSYNLGFSLGLANGALNAPAVTSVSVTFSKVSEPANVSGGDTLPFLRNTTDVTTVAPASTLSVLNGAIAGTISSGGSGTAMDFNVKYRDVIKVNKD